jgi:2-succinyl-6-hydroxy-2,4-cyclohexadiene-1-carboxylate synthase
MTGGEQDGFRAVELPGGLRLLVGLSGAGPLLVLLHGFTGTGQAWGDDVLGALAERFRVAAVDLPGHGGSPVPGPASQWPFHRVVESLAALPRLLGYGSAAWIGYSMGGRLALAVAVEHPGVVTSLAVESGSPGLESEPERIERRAADDRLAGLLEAEGIRSFVDRWQRLPLFSSQSALDASVRGEVRRRRLAQDPMGLAWALRSLGTGRQPSYWESLPHLQCSPTLLVGALDEKFVGINQRMMELLNNGRLEIVQGVGHTVHLEAPREWLRRVVPTSVDGEGVGG